MISESTSLSLTGIEVGSDLSLNPASLCKDIFLTYEDMLVDQQSYSKHIKQALPSLVDILHIQHAVQQGHRSRRTHVLACLSESIPVIRLQAFVWKSIDPDIRTLESPVEVVEAKRYLELISQREVELELQRREYNSLTEQIAKLYERLGALEVELRMPKPKYVLEIEEHIASAPHFVRVGYINFKFASQEDASYFYYDQYPGHRSINRYGDWTSDCGLVDKLRYRVVAYASQNLNVREYLNEALSARIKYLNQQAVYKHYKPSKYVVPKFDWTLERIVE